ncbi:MAG: LamG domain-containing protein, partial [Planctomycetes bacterium]|nr:LamG domain-containing protein [Planctomycetota bacterium]
LKVAGFTDGTRNFDIRVRDVAAGTQVVLPGNAANGGGAITAHYVVIVTQNASATTAPTLAIDAMSRAVEVGQQAGFDIAASGTAPLSYVWQIAPPGSPGQWSDIPGATSPSYSIASPQLADSGTAFRCVVTNAFGNVTSAQAILTVVPRLDPAYSLVGYWPFDEPGGMTAFDASWNGRDGTLHGTTRRPGRVLGALDFNGTGDYVSSSHPGIGGAAPRTVSLWVRTTAASAGPAVAWGSDDAPGGKWYVSLNADPQQGAVGAVRTDVGGGHIVGTTDVADGRWHHLASVFAGANVADVRHYVDGVLDPASHVAPSAVNTVQGAQTVTIGAGLVGGTRIGFAGAIDEIRLDDRALTEALIAALAHPPPRIVPADLDRDGDVDQEDFGEFQACMSGSSKPRPAGCEAADQDNDMDVDEWDFQSFQACFGGPQEEPPCW